MQNNRLFMKFLLLFILIFEPVFFGDFSVLFKFSNIFSICHLRVVSLDLYLLHPLLKFALIGA